MLFEDLVSDCAKALSDVGDFIGVDSQCFSNFRSQPRNVGTRDTTEEKLPKGFWECNSKRIEDNVRRIEAISALTTNWVLSKERWCE